MSGNYFLVRLVNSQYLWNGRLEVYHDDRWGTVCNDSWDDKDAQVVCKQLGYTGGTVNNGYGGGKGDIWLDNVRCTGRESKLSWCPKNYWGQHNCNHNEDAGVECGMSYAIKIILSGNGFKNPLTGTIFLIIIYL